MTIRLKSDPVPDKCLGGLRWRSRPAWQNPLQAGVRIPGLEEGAGSNCRQSGTW